MNSSPICALSKVFENPLRLSMFEKICATEDGISVNMLTTLMHQSGIGQSGVSQYLKQLAALGVIRRVRCGKFVNYIASYEKAAPIVREATAAIVDRLKEKGGDRSFAGVFAVLMNPFRAAVVSAVSRAGSISAERICDRMEHQRKYLKRDLQRAVDFGLLDVTDSDTPAAVYVYREPSDPLVRLLVSLL